MKILLVSTYELKGGAAIACKRLLNALSKVTGVEVRMLVVEKQTEDTRVESIIHSRTDKFIQFFRFSTERFFIWFANRFSKRNLFSVSLADTGNDISVLPVVKEADVIHLHWVNQGCLSLNGIGKLLMADKKVVWTLHDMWTFTGICHYAGLCDGYRSGCRECPLLKKAMVKNLASKVFKRKEKIGYEKIAFVTCSNWLCQIGKESSLLQHSVLTAIPNPIDTDFFRGKDKKKARDLFQFSPDKKLVFLGAAKLTDPRKGFDYFLQALKYIAECYPQREREIELVFLGENPGLNPDDLLPFKSYHVGYLSDWDKIINLYNAVDVFVIPSLEDNLPNTVMEAMACGVPVVGFATGGIPEMVDHKMNGYIAESKNSKELAKGIMWVLYESEYEDLGRCAIKKVENSYSDRIVASKYMEFYKSVLQ